MKKQKIIDSKIADIPSELLAYKEDEAWMYAYVYDYLNYYARENELINTAIALPVARALHNGKYRKLRISRDGVEYRLPYIIHPLLVTRMLADLNTNISKEDEDILLAAALCHDTIEDVEFPNCGKELYEVYGLDQRVYNIVRSVSKRYDFTDEEERAFFHNIESDPLTLMVKLADRGQNVEDMYNMSLWKIHEYIDETNKFFFPMCNYGLQNYPDLIHPLAILKDKITVLTSTSKYLADEYDQRLSDLKAEIAALEEENSYLKKMWQYSLEDEDE